MKRVILVGGAEEKNGERTILREIAAGAQKSNLALCTAGSSIPDELFALYSEIFRELGVKHVQHIRICKRENADDPKLAAAVAQSRVLFFTGGDQLRITSMLAGSRLYDAIRGLYRGGGTVAGTSAGASALGETMPFSAEADEHKVAAAWRLLPALGLLENVIVDQHFAQRGRMGRLIAGVVENRRLLGIGIDENTALIWQRDTFRVIGTGAVYVVDGTQVTQSNVGQARLHSAMSAFDIRLHVLSQGDSFDSATRRPA